MLRKRLAGGIAVMLFLASCGGTGIVTGDQTGFVAADGSAVVLEVSQRQLATNLQAKSVDGSVDWQLSDETGNILLLNTWGPWCAPCRKELPILQNVQDQFAKDGVKVIGMATRTNQAAVELFISQKEISYLQLADFDSAVMVQLDGVPSTTVPSTVFIDRKGRIAGWALGEVEGALFRSIIRSLIAEES
jgi:thiol-disulfide isomerase/thioredoxin